MLHRAMQPLHDAGRVFARSISPSIPLNPIPDSPDRLAKRVVLAIRFKAGLSGGSGSMSLCLPYALIEDLVEDLGTRSWSGSSDGGTVSGHASSVQSHLSDAAVEISAILASTTITLSELRSMQPGDVVSGSPNHVARDGLRTGATKVRRPSGAASWPKSCPVVGPSRVDSLFGPFRAYPYPR